MRDSKIIKKSLAVILDEMSLNDQALHYRLLLLSNDAGIISNQSDFNEISISNLIDAGLITMTEKEIILRGFLSSNYGTVLKPQYNPHKPILEQIQKSGYQYDPEANEIDIPQDKQIRPSQSSNKLHTPTTDIAPLQDDNKAAQSIKTNIVTGPSLNTNGEIIQMLGSIKFALWMSIAVMVAQSIHTSFTMMDLSHLPGLYNPIAAIFTALLIDFLIVYFVINGRTIQSMVFFIFCSLMNLYSYHLQTEYYTYKSFFAIVVSFAIPYAVHSVSKQINKLHITSEPTGRS